MHLHVHLQPSTTTIASHCSIETPGHTRRIMSITHRVSRRLSTITCSSCAANLGLTNRLSRSKRSYYSLHHPDPSPFSETQDRILSAAIAHVPKYGFTDEALSLGAKDAGYLDVTVQLFPRHAFDLIHYHLVKQRLALKNNVQFPEGTQLGLGAKVRALAMARLRANADIIHQWQGVRVKPSRVRVIY